MGRGNETMGKKAVREKLVKKREEKEKKRLNRKSQSRDGNNLDDMIAYVDENGQITSTPPDLSQKVVINVEDIEIGVPRNRPELEGDNMHHGSVVFFNESKGFGFIRDSSTKREIFVHANALNEPIKENNLVTFEIAKGPRGISAVNVSIERQA